MSQLIVKHRSFWHTRPGVALIILLFMLLLLAVFEFGRIRAGYNTLVAAQTVEGLNLQISQLEQQQAQLRGEKAVLQRSSQIERQAYKQLEGTVAELQDEILELKEELAFYRGIVSPKDANKGLKLQDFELTAGAQPRQHHFKVVLTQVLNNATVARGSLHFEVQGLQQGVEKRYTLEQMSEGKQATAFRFKYFQVLEGDFILPEEFEPLKVNLTVKPKSRAHKKLTQAFDWVVGESN